MAISNKLAAFAAGFAVLAAPMFAAAAEAKAKHHHHHHHLRHFAKKPHIRGLRYSPDGDLIDRDGWRLRSGVWDNTCFNLDYMASVYACSGSRRR